MSILNTIGKFIVGALISTGVIAMPAAPVATPVSSPNLGAAITQGGALYDGFLASGIAQNATSMTLTTGSFKDGTSLSGWNCFTVDANSPSIEYICGNASGTVVSNLMRGVGLVNPNTTSTALTFYHGRGASVQITDYPDLQILKRIVNGTDPFPNAISFGSHTPCNAANSSTAVDWYCVSQVATSGAPDAGFSSKGLVAITTPSGAPTSTDGSSVLFNLISKQYYASSSQATTSVVMTKGDGTIDSSFVPSSTIASAVSSSPTFPYVPVGTINSYVSSTAPTGWLLCNGQTVATSTYPTLFALIGYTYGGSTSTFGVPNLAGRFLAGASSSLSSTIGATGGSLTATGTASVNYGFGNGAGPGGGGSPVIYGPTATGAGVSTGTFSGTATSTAIPPYFIVNYIIKY